MPMVMILLSEQTRTRNKIVQPLFLDLILEKYCSGCGQIQSLNNFCKNKSAKDGLHNYCKKCLNASTKNV
jgi:hypothetical protein